MPDTYRSAQIDTLRDNLVTPFFIGAGYDQDSHADRDERADALASTIVDSGWLEDIIAAAEQRGRRAEQARLARNVDDLIADLAAHRDQEETEAEYRNRDGAWVDVRDAVRHLLPNESFPETFTDVSRLADDSGVKTAVAQGTGLGRSQVGTALRVVADYLAVRDERNDAGPLS